MGHIRSRTSVRRTHRGCECSPSVTEERSGRYHRANGHETPPTHRHIGQRHGYIDQEPGAGVPRLSDRVDQLAAAQGGGPAGTRRAGTVLDLFLRQLAPDASLYPGDRKSTRLNSSHMSISYAVFCLKKKTKKKK